MLNNVRSWLYVGNELRLFVVLDGLPDLYRLKYDSVTVCGLPLYLCSYKLDGYVTHSAWTTITRLFLNNSLQCVVYAY